jgi:phosphatidylglycerol lysyltransferase
MSEKLKRLARSMLPFAAAGIFFAALYFMCEAMREIHYHDVLARLRSYTPSVILMALAATAFNYLVLTVYDVLALRFTCTSLPCGRVAFTSFLCYVFSYNVGCPYSVPVPSGCGSTPPGEWTPAR